MIYPDTESIGGCRRELAELIS